MNEKEIEERLRKAIEKTAPNDFYGVLSRVSDEKGSPVMTMKKKHNRFISGAAAACLALAILGGGGTYYAKACAVSSIVSLDVNPSIELRVNSREKILVCAPLNDEAVKVLADMDGGKDLKGVDLSVAVNALIGALVRNGYLDSVSSSILISVEDKNEERAAKLRREVTETVDSVLAANSSGASVLSQTLGKDPDLDSIAKDHNISTGKAALANRVLELNSSLDFTSLAALSVDELRDLIETGAPGMPIGKSAAGKIALTDAGLSSDSAVIEVDSDIDEAQPHYDVDIEVSGAEYEYKIDAFTGDILEKKTDRSNENKTVVTPTPDKTSDIGLDDAKAIALKHAGISEKNAVFTKAETDRDDGRIEYEFEFIVGNTEYDCKVSAAGNVIEFKTETVKTVTTPEKTSDIGLDAAKAIALKHAGVSEKNAIFTKAETDRDDGVIEYEFEFIVGNTEYDCKVSASGTVIEFETETVDHDDRQTPTVSTSDIGADAAKTAAFRHAGVSSANVFDLEIERDTDDGRVEYEIEFKCGNIEYEYKIDGATGSILEHEADIDD